MNWESLIIWVFGLNTVTTSLFGYIEQIQSYYPRLITKAARCGLPENEEHKRSQ